MNGVFTTYVRVDYVFETTLLADLDVHPRVAMHVLRHAQFALTMEIYTVVSSDATREALKRLGERLGGPGLSADETENRS